jgi:hypothetical protein
MAVMSSLSQCFLCSKTFIVYDIKGSILITRILKCGLLYKENTCKCIIKTAQLQESNLMFFKQLIEPFVTHTSPISSDEGVISLYP